MSLVADSKTNKDLLGREKFAKQIINSLRNSFTNTHDGIVVGVSGSWGSGKSTLLEFIKKEINFQYKTDNYTSEIIEFNSWGNSSDDSLERNFLEKVLKAVEGYKQTNQVKIKSEKIKSFLKLTRPVKFLKHTHSIAKDIFDTIDAYIEAMPSLDEVKEEANTIVLNNKIKLFILIDDLDRLTPKEITSLFRILKVNLNLVNTIFIIAYDKNVVVNALSNEYNFDGEKYLEKIIQVDFAVPPILRSQIENIYFNRLEDYLSVLSFEIDILDLKNIWKLHGFNEYFNSIRDINRYFNNLVFSLPNIGDDINIQDFLLLEAIRTFDVNSYNQLYHSVPLINRKRIWESIEIDSTFFKSFNNETTQSILNVLFTRDYKTTNTGFGKRLRDMEYFERYFSLNIPDTDISSDNLKRFFVENSSKKSILRQIYADGKIKNFLNVVINTELNFRFSNKDLGVFKDFIDFWESMVSIPSEYKKLIIDTYFKFIKLFEDTHRSSTEAIKSIYLSTHGKSSVKFLINHFIHNGNIPTYKHDDYGQIEEHKERLYKFFKDFLVEKAGFCFLKIREGEGDWVDNHFIHSLALHASDVYIENLDRNISKPNLLHFIAKNFYMYASNEEVAEITDDDCSLLFPKDLLKKAIEEIEKMPETSLRLEDYNALQLFASTMKQRRRGNLVNTN